MAAFDGEPDEHWLRSAWRPAMAWSYFTICLCDFLVFPAASAALTAAAKIPYHEWHPLTLQGGGLYHMAMGAIIGVTAWTRSQEKMASFGTPGYGGGYGGGAMMAERETDDVRPQAQQQRSSRAD